MAKCTAVRGSDMDFLVFRQSQRPVFVYDKQIQRLSLDILEALNASYYEGCRLEYRLVPRDAPSNGVIQLTAGASVVACCMHLPLLQLLNLPPLLVFNACDSMNFERALKKCHAPCIPLSREQGDIV